MSASGPLTLLEYVESDLISAKDLIRRADGVLDDKARGFLYCARQHLNEILHEAEAKAPG